MPHHRRDPRMRLHTALLATLAVLTAVPARGQGDPVEWRNRRGRAPREQWDALEGEVAPSLASIGDWRNVEPLDWPDLRGNVVLLCLWEAWDRRGSDMLQHLAELAKIGRAHV